MKRLFKYLTVTTTILVAWTLLAFFGTRLGWLHSPITNGNTYDAFSSEVKNIIQNEFVGNFALAVIEDGHVIDEIFYSAGKPVTRNTIFQVASLSKWISAIGVMKLVENGKIDLDSPVSRYLTRWQLPTSEFNNEAVTVRRLLSHTAGLTDRLGYSGFAPGKPVQTLEESLTMAADADEGISGVVMVAIEPGSEFKYSGGGYTLLQLIVEEVTNQSFASYMKEQVLTPLGMNASSYLWDDSTRVLLRSIWASVSYWFRGRSEVMVMSSI